MYHFYKVLELKAHDLVGYRFGILGDIITSNWLNTFNRFKNQITIISKYDLYRIKSVPEEISPQTSVPYSYTREAAWSR